MEKAREYIEFIEKNEANFDFKNRVRDIHRQTAYHELLREKFRILFFSRNYKEAYKFSKKHTKELKKTGAIFAAELFIEKKLGISPSSPADAYLRAQVLDYSEDLFMQHIKKHTIDGDGKMNYFSADFPLELAIEEIKKLIPNENSYYSHILNEKYYFKYDFCGLGANRTSDYFLAVALFGSNDLVTMYPFNEGGGFNYIDLNYLKKKQENTKIRKISQIDKFNKKYNR